MSEHDEVFDAWVREHGAVLRRFAATRVPSSEVDDVVQDALVRAWTRRETFDPSRGTPRAWLLGIVLDRTRALWRRSATRLPVEHPGRDQAIGEPSEASLVQSLDLRQAINRLPRRQREVIILHYYVDANIEDTALALSLSPGTVKSTLYDARQALARRLEGTVSHGYR